MTGVDTDLATLRDSPYEWIRNAARNLEAELSRLREQRDAAKEEERAEWNPLYGRLEQERRRQVARAEAAEAALVNVAKAAEHLVELRKHDRGPYYEKAAWTRLREALAALNKEPA